jgi:methyltransferase family protein
MTIHDLYRPFLHYFRRRRMQWLQERFRITGETRILDVGGFLFNWSLIPVRPRLTILNLDSPGKTEEAATWVIADARSMPFQDGTFEIVYSNSVIEHLGDFANQQKFAQEIERVGLRYYVQTPNRWFPVEPHLITPLIHFLPRTWQARLLRNFTVWGLVTRPSREQCAGFLEEVALLDYRKMRSLFPGAEIRRERFLGFTKSLIAVKG